MKILAIILGLLLSNTLVFGFDINANIVVDGQMDLKFIAQKVFVPSEGDVEREQQVYYFDVRTNGVTTLSQQFSDNPMVNVLEIDTVGLHKTQVEEKVILRAQYTTKEEVVLVENSWLVKEMSFITTTNFENRVYDLTTTGDGAFDFEIHHRVLDDELCEKYTFQLDGRGDFTINLPDTGIGAARSFDPDDPPELQYWFKNTLCPWQTQGVNSTGFG